MSNLIILYVHLSKCLLYKFERIRFALTKIMLKKSKDNIILAGIQKKI